MRSGTNLPMVRDYNQGVVLEAIRTGEGASRIEISRETGLNAQTISNIVRRLIEQGLVYEAGKGESSGGKPRTKLRINPDAGYSVGVQIDGDETSYVIIDLEGEVVSRDRRPTQQDLGPAGVLEQVAASIHRLVNGAEIARGKILGVGVACPGLKDYGDGLVHRPKNLRGWHRVPLGEILERETGYPVIVNNDATAAAIGERWAGGARGVQSFAFIYMGVGVGAGLYLEDRVYRGRTGGAGEFGHTSLNPEGPECSCGNRGCVETYVAPEAVVAAVARRLRRREESSLQEVFQAAAAPAEGPAFDAIRRAAIEGDRLAREEIERAAWMLGCGLVNLVNLLDIELIVLGGKYLRGVENIYLQKAEQVLRERIIARDRYVPRVELSQAGEDAGAVGGASTILYHIYTPRLKQLGKAG